MVKDNSRYNDGILCLIEKHIEEGLDHKYLREIAMKYHSDHRKHRYELVEEQKKQVNRIFIDEKLTNKVIMGCRTTTTYKFRTRLGFKQYVVILTKEQSVLTINYGLIKRENFIIKLCKNG